MSRVARVLLAVVVTLGGLAVFAEPSSAHAGLVSSDPADGATLATPPDQILLTFSEPPDLGLSAFGMLDASGAELMLRAPIEGTGNREVVLSPVEAFGDGVYTVTFRAVSETDGHLTAGSIAFGVGAVTGAVVPTGNAPTETPWPSALSVIGKALLYVGLIMIVAAAVVGLGAFGGEVPGRRVLLPVAGAATLVGACLMLIADARSVGAGLEAVARSGAGAPFLRLIAACAVVAVVAAIAGVRGTSLWLVVAGDAAAAAMLVRATGGHAGAHPLQVIVQWVHLMVIAIWVGGFAVLLLLLRARPPSRPPVAEVAAYSRLAGYALLVVVTSGMVRTFDELDGWSGIAKALDTPYGTTLAIKVGLVIALIGLGAVNRLRAIPRLTDGSPMLARVVGVEVVTAIAILGLTATLTGLPPHPPASRPSTPTAAVLTVEGSDFATTVHVALDVGPGAPGPNTYDLRVDDFDSGEPVAADGVTLRFEAIGRPDLTSSIDLVLGMDGMGSMIDHWTGEGTELSVPGPWTVTATITTGSEATEVAMSLSIEPADQQVDVVSQDGLPTIVTFTSPDERKLQYYADPGVAGPNQLHLTAFDGQGQELALADATIIATQAGSAPQVLDTTRFSPGHFVANSTLAPGRWHIDVLATTEDGGVLTGAYDQTIGQE
ncbi:MAG: copper resistance protein CopC [Actinomycetota bacterium]